MIESKKRILLKDRTIQGFNMGIKNGADAGQTIPQTHLHLIPRREQNVKNPTGGIRNIILEKGDYSIKS